MGHYYVDFQCDKCGKLSCDCAEKARKRKAKKSKKKKPKLTNTQK